MLSRRVSTPRPSQSVRFRSSTTTYSIPLSSSSVLRLDLAVTSKEVTLKLVETETVATETKAVETTIIKTVGDDKQSKTSDTTSTPIPEVVECWVGTSITHITIVIDNRYKTFALKPGWTTKTHDAHWAEAAAIELTVEYLAQHGYTGHAQIRSGSATALLAMSGGKVRVPEAIESVHRTNSILETSNFTMKTVKVPAKENIAHQLSHGKIANADEYEELGGGLTIPKALAPFMEAL